MPETAISLRGKGLIGIQGPMIYNTETGMVDIPADKITTASIAIQPRPVDCCVALAHWREFKHAKIVEQKWRKWTFGFSIAAIFISALSAATAVYTSFFTLTQSHKDTSSIVADSDTSTDISPQSDPIDVAEQAEK